MTRISKRGFFAIVTAFLVIIAVVVALVGFFSLYQVVFKVNAAKGDYSKGFAVAQQFKNRMLLCGDGTIIDEAKLAGNECPLSPDVLGYRIVQDPLFGCEEKNWSSGAAEGKRYMYWVVVKQQDASTCLAQLQIYE